MPTQTAKEWVRWIYDNHDHYTASKSMTLGKIARMSNTEAVEYCQDYIKAMIKADGKRNILWQEKQMIHQLGLEV